jgi:Mor family transcriptional regulator
MSRSDSQMEHRRHELLEAVHLNTRQQLIDLGIDSDVADQAGCAVSEMLARDWGGQLVNIPKDHHYKLAARDVAIYEKFNGTNHDVLAREHGVTVRAIYKIIKRVRAMGDPNQDTLF